MDKDTPKHIAIIKYKNEVYYVYGIAGRPNCYSLSKVITVTLDISHHSVRFRFVSEFPDMEMENEFEFDGAVLLKSKKRYYMVEFYPLHDADARTINRLEFENENLKRQVDILKKDLELLIDTKAFIDQSEKLSLCQA